MDCLRTAIRCGAAEALCIYRRDRANMPGSRKEYDNSIEEGARFSFLTSPVSLLGDAEGRVTTVRCVRMELGAPDSSGRRSPRPVRGSEFDVPVDVVLTAYGFELVPFPPGSDLATIKRNDRGEIVVDDQQMTSMSGVFAGGDLVRGERPALLLEIDATDPVASGKASAALATLADQAWASELKGQLAHLASRPGPA